MLLSTSEEKLVCVCVGGGGASFTPALVLLRIINFMPG